MQKGRIALLKEGGGAKICGRNGWPEHRLVAVAASKSPVISSPIFCRPDARHAASRERDKVERRLLGRFRSSRSTVLRLATGHYSPNTLAWLQSHQPDFVILYGSSIIKPPLLDFYKDKMINLHLGLSPYYRGSGTNFWPLVNREPECIGATIHLAVQRVDAGEILAQVRPAAEAGDRAHELGTKTIVAALDLMPHIRSLYAAGQIAPATPDLSLGRNFRQEMFQCAGRPEMWQHFDTGDGRVPRVVEERSDKYPIVNLEMTVA